MERSPVSVLMTQALPDINLSKEGGRHRIIYSYQNDHGPESSRQSIVNIVRTDNFFQIPTLCGTNYMLLVDRDIPFSDIKEGHVRMRSKMWRTAGANEKPWQIWTYIKSITPA
tara:strand:- start:548 stop:886 length:339 start_codon:yes stop_codon:yes gene_type:complete